MQILRSCLPMLLLLDVFVVQVWSAALPENSPKTVTNETWRKCFESLKGLLKEGMDISPIKFNFEPMKKLKGSFTSYSSLNDVKIEHANNFTVEFAQVNLEKLNFLATIVFPELSLTGHYVAKRNSGSFYLNGDGDFSIYATKFLLHLNITLDKNHNETLELKYFTVNYSAVDIKSSVENIVAGNDLVNSILSEGFNDFIPIIINSLKPEAQIIMNELAHVYGDFLVDGMTQDQLIDLINSLC